MLNIQHTGRHAVKMVSVDGSSSTTPGTSLNQVLHNTVLQQPIRLRKTMIGAAGLNMPTKSILESTRVTLLQPVFDGNQILHWLLVFGSHSL